jgi:hypothetical protein
MIVFHVPVELINPLGQRLVVQIVPVGQLHNQELFPLMGVRHVPLEQLLIYVLKERFRLQIIKQLLSHANNAN